MTRVLFLCTHNSARSQIAEGFLRAMAGDRFEAERGDRETRSIRRDPGMAERDRLGGILEGYSDCAPSWDYLITVCATQRGCPWVPGSVGAAAWSS